MNLIPYVKKIDVKDTMESFKSIKPFAGEIDCRIKKQIDKLPSDSCGADLIINVGDADCEKYAISIEEDSITIDASGLKGVFYAVQTLRQGFTHNEIPCLHIEDEPDFPYRGFYHDISRGKIPTVETIKKLIDEMAYYKLNSLQLYVEHVYEFKETKEVTDRTDSITPEELKEIEAYCEENFMEFIPSLSTFGHMYEILELEQYKHLRVAADYEAGPNFWLARMMHHTIEPESEESIELVKSFIDQYYPNFKSKYFNICGDETFDLSHSNERENAGEQYLDFALKLIDHVTSKGKTTMMWADILLKYPEVISKLPDDVCLLNWSYVLDPSEENIRKISELGKKQIVCPGIGTWNRFCEKVEKEINISKMAEYGYKHGAIGVLNTSWGDWGNVASIEMGMYGLVTGAVKAWAVNTELDSDYYAAVSEIVYGKSNAMDYIKRVSDMHALVKWDGFCTNYFEHRYGGNSHPDAIRVELKFDLSEEDIAFIQKEYKEITAELENEKWGKDEIREELLLCVEALAVIAELSAKMSGFSVPHIVDTMTWLEKYKAKWLLKNKKSELHEIENVFTYLNTI